METFKITEESKNKILLYSAQTLPDRPGERGMKAQDTKAFFYKYIGVLIEEINTVLANIINGVSSDINAHDALEGAHPFLLKLISDLQARDAELGTAIGGKVNSHNTSTNTHLDIRQKITKDIVTHNASSTAHGDIRELITALDTIAHDAYNLASGKSKVHPCEGGEALIREIESGELILHPGDVVIFKDTLFPDFVVFATGQESKPEDDSYLSDFLSPEAILQVGSSYYYEGITFVALESGIDTSKLASTEDLALAREKLISTINELGRRLVTAENTLLKKEDKLTTVESTDAELTLATHTEYNLGLITELKVSLPGRTDGLEAIINFRCGATAPSIDMPDEVLFQGDDTLDGRLYPITNRLYEINIKKVMGIIIAKVGAADYEVIE